MNKNLKRHKLLGLLSSQYVKVKSKHESILGVDFETLEQSLKCTREQLIELSSTLITEEEIDYHDAYSVKGLYAKPKGVSSYSIKKYKLENEKITFDRIRNWVQTSIPIISLLITISTIISSEQRITQKQNELIRSENKVEKLDLKVIELETKIDTLNTLIQKIKNTK